METGGFAKCISFKCLILRFAGVQSCGRAPRFTLFLYIPIYVLFVEFRKVIKFKVLVRSSNIYQVHSVHIFRVPFLFYSNGFRKLLLKVCENAVTAICIEK